MSTGKREFTKFVNLENEITLHHYADGSKDRTFYIQLAEERIKESPEDYHSYILLGNEYRVKGSPEKAIEKYKAVLEKFDSTLTTIEKAAIYYALGQAYYATKDAVRSMTSYANGIAINKTYRDNYYGLAVILTGNNMLEAAIGIIKEALANTVQAYFWMEDSST